LCKFGVTYDLIFFNLTEFRPALRNWPELTKIWPEL
jgi:hypothetical protein